jgi:hypothetical protein
MRTVAILVDAELLRTTDWLGLEGAKKVSDTTISGVLFIQNNALQPTYVRSLCWI